MRRTGNEKLRGQRGASLLIALLFTLVGAMVAIVIINAASTAVKRMYDDTQREQEYLTLESAALLLKSELEDMNPAYQVEVTEIAEGEYNYEYMPTEGQALSRKICDAITGNGREVSLTLSEPAFEEAEEEEFPFKPVKMTIIMNQDEMDSDVFHLTATIQLADLENAEAQKLFLTAQSYLSAESSTEEGKTVKEYGFQGATLQTRLNDGVSGGSGA